MTYEAITEKLLQHFTGAEYAAEVIDGKKEFFERAGIIDEKTDYFESRMAQFLDWYLYSRELSKYHVTPVQLMVERPPIPVSAEEIPVYESMAQARHSLFEFIKIKGRDVYVEDLFEGKKLIIQNSHIVAGFNTDEIFDNRIIKFNGQLIFANGFCFHPPEVKKFILKEIKKVKHLDKTQQEELMFRLMKMRYRHEQYRHIKLEFIYSNDQKLRI